MNREKMLELVQGQLQAYNQRDLEKFCQHFHPQVKVMDLQRNALICEGIESFREIYRNRFESNPELHCEIKHRTVLEKTVLDEEWVTGVSGAAAPSHLMALYSFEDNLIRQVWFAR